MNGICRRIKDKDNDLGDKAAISALLRDYLISLNF
jgi:hypothetical protein